MLKKTCLCRRTLYDLNLRSFEMFEVNNSKRLLTCQEIKHREKDRKEQKRAAVSPTYHYCVTDNDIVNNI